MLLLLLLAKITRQRFLANVMSIIKRARPRSSIARPGRE